MSFADDLRHMQKMLQTLVDLKIINIDIAVEEFSAYRDKRMKELR